MLRRLIAVAAFAAAASPLANAADADPCAQTRTAKVTFTSPGDIVTATSLPGPVAPEGGGDNCRNATVVLTVHSVEGVLMASFSAALVAASFDLGHTEEPVPAARLGAFLDEWVKVEITTSDKAPARDAEGVATTLPAEDYDAIKAAKAPMLCYQAGAFARTCLAPDNSGYAVQLYTIEQT